jgi:hypothetical protein
MVPSQVRDLLTDLLQRQREAEVPTMEPDPVTEDAAEPCTSDSHLHAGKHNKLFSTSLRHRAWKARAAAGCHPGFGKGAE